MTIQGYWRRLRSFAPDRKAMVIACVLLMPAFAAVSFAADPLVKLETAAPIEICPTCKSVRALLIPDQQSSIKVDEQPAVEQVFLGGTAPRDATKFGANWVGKPPRAIAISLDAGETNQAGVYDLYLDLQPNSSPGAPRLKIQVSRPAASLEPIPKLIIDRTYWFINAKSDTHPKLRVIETSHKSGVTISAVRPVTNASIGTKAISGILDFTPAKQQEIAPGDNQELDYKLDGDFELGTATGTMKIDAPQLGAPAPFDFEVRSRVHWIYIGITVAIGLFISYLVKVTLQQSIEFDQAHLDAQKLVDKIQQEAARHADPAFAAAYQNQLQALTEAMSGHSPAEINNAKVALDTAWRAALVDLAKRHQDQIDALNKLRDITSFDWLVPPEISRAVARARDAQAGIVQLIDRDDLAAADRNRNQIVRALADDLRTATFTWQSSEQQILANLQSGFPGISALTTSALTKPATDVLASLHKVDVNTPLATTEQIQQALADIKFERTSVQQFFRWLATIIRMEHAKAETQIPNPPPPFWDAKVFGLAGDAVTVFSNFLGTLTDQPNEADLVWQAAAVHQTWTAALQGQFPAPNAAVQAQLDAHDYIRATMVAFQEKSPAPPLALVALGAPAAAIHVAPEFQRDIAAAATGPTYAIRTVVQTIAMPVPAVRTAVTDADQLRKEKLLQSLILGALLIIAAYGLQLNTFVGTFTDFSTLFFWAFGLDIAVDQVSRLTKKA